MQKMQTKNEMEQTETERKEKRRKMINEKVA